ncbi:ProQ/FinO family protein [Neptuniibacter pectenicola]|jgi:ProP effector|uniref:ProQ/FinO family protein n=1 Tax=Neptuniibacter pectenicola TaxID=1806669 RepID=A0ABU9TP00_9GAMM|nr:ProQ/FinO family protein [Neptuniibacter pectenicola]|tara:strand:- start:3967 stop:4545 length:579 start_codon:yes stop_codon:yes gene_type:complete
MSFLGTISAKVNSDIHQIFFETKQLIDQLEQLLESAEKQQNILISNVFQSEANKVNDVVNKAPKAKSKNRAANMAALQQLMEAYPKTFDRKNVRPLKIGIQEDLIADEKVAKNKIKRALASYVRALNYYRSLREGAERIDINGEAAGLVTKEESEHAKQKLKEINKARQEKRQEQEREERLSMKLEMLVNRS